MSPPRHEITSNISLESGQRALVERAAAKLQAFNLMYRFGVTPPEPAQTEPVEQLTVAVTESADAIQPTAAVEARPPELEPRLPTPDAPTTLPPRKARLRVVPKPAAFSDSLAARAVPASLSEISDAMTRGDKPDIDQVILAFLPTISRIAQRLRPSNAIKDDMEQVGRFAVWRAYEEYGTERGMDFERYAAVKIKQKMVDFLREELPVSRHDYGAMKQVRELESVNLTDAEIARELGVTPAWLDQLRLRYHRMGGLLSLQGTVHTNGDVVDIAPATYESGYNEVECAVMAPGRTMRDLLEKTIQTASPGAHIARWTDRVVYATQRDRDVFIDRYCSDKTIAEIAHEHSMTESRVSQICALIKSRIVTYLKDAPDERELWYQILSSEYQYRAT